MSISRTKNRFSLHRFECQCRKGQRAASCSPLAFFCARPFSLEAVAAREYQFNGSTRTDPFAASILLALVSGVAIELGKGSHDLGSASLMVSRDSWCSAGTVAEPRIIRCRLDSTAVRAAVTRGKPMHDLQRNCSIRSTFAKAWQIVESRSAMTCSSWVHCTTRQQTTCSSSMSTKFLSRIGLICSN